MSTNNLTERLPQLETLQTASAPVIEQMGITDRRWFLFGVFWALGAVCVGFWVAAAAFVLSAL